jgi:hypothetical protein
MIMPGHFDAYADHCQSIKRRARDSFVRHPAF